VRASTHLGVRILASGCAVALFVATASGQTPTERAWKILQDGVAENGDDDRVAALHSLGLIVKNDRARSRTTSPKSSSRRRARCVVSTIPPHIRSTTPF
jgi:hypothetical protein